MTDAELSGSIRQDWDPSILVLLSGFPTVIERMAEDLDWTEQLGDAMLAQDEDVLVAVQRMREEALTMGNLVSNEAQVVEEEADQIYIRPAYPEVVYLPSYDPVTTYTMSSLSPRATSPGNVLTNPWVAGALGFGAAVLVDELFGDDHSDEGWDEYWGRRPIDWRDREVYPRFSYANTPRGYESWDDGRNRCWDRAHHRWHRDDARSGAR